MEWVSQSRLSETLAACPGLVGHNSRVITWRAGFSHQGSTQAATSLHAVVHRQSQQNPTRVLTSRRAQQCDISVFVHSPGKWHRHCSSFDSFQRFVAVLEPSIQHLVSRRLNQRPQNTYPGFVPGGGFLCGIRNSRSLSTPSD